MDQKTEFREIYEAHRAGVHAYFVGRTGDRWLAADLMQEVFVRVWQQFPELAGRTVDGQRAWIFTVARNLSIDAHRRERTRSETVTSLARQPGPATPTAGASVIAAERLAVVGEAIKRLPERQRTTLTMAAAGDLTSAEIATALGIQPGTVRYRLSLARRALAEELAEYDRPPAEER